MLRRATREDKIAIERIVNDPACRRHNAHDGASSCDAAKYLEPPSFALIAGGGCFLFPAIGPSRYAVHTNFLPGHRGASALAAACEALCYVFVCTDAEELHTMVPGNNPAATWFTRKMAFRPRFTRDGAWRQGGADHAMTYYSLHVDDWIIQGHAAEIGRGFHRDLAQSVPLTHRDDPVHDAYAGAAAAMVCAGQALKGISIYNRWARLAGYVPAVVLSEKPLRIDIRDCVLRHDGGPSFSVEAPCQSH